MIRDLRNGLEVLSSTECATLLANTAFGRIAIVTSGEPSVFPIQYAYDRGDIVLCTGPGSRLDRAAHGEQVAFEIDATDTERHAGWSVLVNGRVDHVVEPDDVMRLEQLPLRPWVPRPRTRWIRVRPYSVTGRRIPRP